jgi:TIR domain
MDIFLSYSRANRKEAESLFESLKRLGLSVWFDKFEVEAGDSVPYAIEKGIRTSSNIVLLIGPRDSEEPSQQTAWRIALEAVWNDPRKRLIPVLTGGAELPPFVQSSSEGGQLKAMRIRGMEDCDRAAAAIKGIAHGKTAGKRAGREQDMVFDVSLGIDREEHSRRLSEIEDFAKNLLP